MLALVDPATTPGLKQTMVSRADLLDLLGGRADDPSAGDEHRLREQAALFGFYHRESKKQPETNKGVEIAGQPLQVRVTESTSDPPLSSPSQNIPKASFYYVSGYQVVERDESVTEEPQWLAKVPMLGPGDGCPDPELFEPATPPLMVWSRLWPFLRLALGELQRTRTIDSEQLVKQVSEGRILRRLPYLRRKAWASACCLLMDFSEYLLPFWDDFNQLCELVRRLRGKAGLEPLKLEEGPNGPCRPFGDPWAPQGDFVPPPAGTPLLILGDLGCGLEDEAKQRSWQRFGRRLRRAGLRPMVLMVCPPRLWKRELMELFFHVPWDRDGRLPKRLAGPSVPPRGGASKPLVGPQQLLELLSPAIRVEPALLRAARYLLPASSCDVGCEIAAWNHRDVVVTPGALSYKNREIIIQYRKGFQKSDEALRSALHRLVQKYHAHLHTAIAYEEAHAFNELNGMKVGIDNEPELLKRVVKTLANNAGDVGLHSWLRRVGSRLHPGMWKSPVLSAAWVFVHKGDLEKGGLELPPGLDLKQVAWVFGSGLPARKYSLRQIEESFVLQSLDVSPAESNKDHLTHSPLVDITCNLPVVDLRLHVPEKEEGLKGGINIGEQTPLTIPKSSGFTLRSDNDIFTIDLMERPAWAEAMGRDQYGLFADFEVKSVRQRMRWIPPGRFLMGSPEDEPERYDDESQHEVVLSKGFWLADTVCTQALWYAVMGTKPSEFKGERRPVDSVSWKDCMKFIAEVNGVVAGLDMRLPSEAEWEYGCRAGTDTPFSFGLNITSEQVNFDGTAPYVDGEKSEYREKTVEVKSLPSNSWGLYEMHGNVLEWCADRMGDYPRERVVDPIVSDKGEDRVLRGGSWFDDGRLVRSAFRGANHPAFRDRPCGFRLARGQ